MKEESFRQKQLVNYKINKNIQFLNSHIKWILSVVSSINNKLKLRIESKPNSSYLENYNNSIKDLSKNTNKNYENKTLKPWWISQKYTKSQFVFMSLSE